LLVNVTNWPSQRETFMTTRRDFVELSPRLRMVHLKDVKAEDDEANVLPGTGVAKISAVMQELHRQNCEGLIAIEYEKKGDVDRDMTKQLA
jgi:sugar phosphate isomerase/epimerase